MMMNMVGCFAQFEREIIVERIKRGLEHARANGKIGGGRYKLSPDDQREAIRLIQVDKKSQGQVAHIYKVDPFDDFSDDDRGASQARFKGWCVVSVPQSMRKQFLDRFDKLVTDGAQIRDSMIVNRETTAWGATSTHTELSDPQRFSKWETICLTLFDTFTRQGSKLKERVDEFSHARHGKTGVQFRLGVLEAFCDNFEQGFLDDLLLKLEAEVAA